MKVHQKIQKLQEGQKAQVHARGLRRSKHVVKYSCETYARENDEEEEKEKEILNSYQSTFITLQLFLTQ
ncbi:hypothetical protein C1645_829771 [Glomus cerebriforme]|uniref:Uncharacterized protein n=1 Tax=Glomus cerebriforme TaxID=658196 RepID=A0A397STT7_9GLOM|nr:hypothetical protein C1645_829771 [Glomus cerebriforme]